MRIWDIEWDVEKYDSFVGEKEYVLSTLPSEVVITDPDTLREIDIRYGDDEYIADYLANTYGCQVKSFLAE